VKPAALALGASLLASGAFADSRELSLGFEEFHYRTAETALNRGNVLGLEENEDLLRGTIGFKESHGSLRLVFRGFVEQRFRHDADADWTTREAYAQYGFGEGLQVRVGKQRVGWGSGFAWNPTSRLEPPKNPLNPSLEQEGALAVRTDWLPTAWAGVILVAAQTERAGPDLPLDAPPTTRRTAAIRTRLLVRDTDVAVVFSGGHNQRTLVGLDVGRTFGSVSAHAEASTYRGAELLPARDDQRFARLATGLLWTRGRHRSRPSTSTTARATRRTSWTSTCGGSTRPTRPASTRSFLPRCARRRSSATSSWRRCRTRVAWACAGTTSRGRGRAEPPAGSGRPRCAA
jgi:hypothetical protein